MKKCEGWVWRGAREIDAKEGEGRKVKNVGNLI
jgi:hypothetical protein